MPAWSAEERAVVQLLDAFESYERIVRTSRAATLTTRLHALIEARTREGYKPPTGADNIFDEVRCGGV